MNGELEGAVRSGEVRAPNELESAAFPQAREKSSIAERTGNGASCPKTDSLRRGIATRSTDSANTGGLAVFNLEDIYAVVFRCRECRTEVNLLRIRWSHSPECCPNCGVPWMRDSSAEPVHPDDISGRAFESIEALRLALQSLACLATHMDFKIGLVTDRGVNHPYIVVSDHQEGNDKSRE